MPTAVASGTAAGTAVYGDAGSQPATVDIAGGPSPYGTIGQNSNIEEWLETSTAGDNSSPSEARVFRGTAWDLSGNEMPSSFRGGNLPYIGSGLVGFRVASVPASAPEPSSTGLIIGPCLMFLARRRRARSL